MEKVYKERANGQWEFWTYCDGDRVYLSRAMADKMIRQGARLVLVK